MVYAIRATFIPRVITVFSLFFPQVGILTKFISEFKGINNSARIMNLSVREYKIM
jgi:hypothetical protein